MPPVNRATKAATGLLEAANVKRLPVKVRELARKHAFVMRESLPQDVSGMLVPADPDSSKRWIIVLNRDHGRERQRFTIAHELGHLLLHQYTSPHADRVQRVQFRDSTSAQGTDREEIEANQFAAELLMPVSLMVPRLKDAGLDSWDGEVTGGVAETLEELANECQVSQQALVFRIANLLQNE